MRTFFILAIGDLVFTSQSEFKPLNRVTIHLNDQKAHAALPWHHQARTMDWHLVKTLRPDNNLNPKGILVLDVDNTLVSEKNTFMQLDRVTKIIKNAYDNGYIIVIATARPYELDFKNPISVKQLLDKINPEYFTWVYYTNGQPKVHVLYHLLDKYFQNNALAKNKICMVDDMMDFLQPCINAGFKTIHVDSGTDYLDKMEAFVDNVTDIKQLENTLKTLLGTTKSYNNFITQIAAKIKTDPQDLMTVFKTAYSVIPDANKMQFVVDISKNSLLWSNIMVHLINENNLEIISTYLKSKPSPTIIKNLIMMAIHSEHVSRKSLHLLFLSIQTTYHHAVAIDEYDLKKLINSAFIIKVKMLFDILQIEFSDSHLPILSASLKSPQQQITLLYLLKKYIHDQEKLTIKDKRFFSIFKHYSHQEKIAAAKRLVNILTDDTELMKFTKASWKDPIYSDSTKLGNFYSSMETLSRSMELAKTERAFDLSYALSMTGSFI
jgi:hydroxymethylpyrimidine pyrophosphatase-like HAD family hydrolase